MITRTVSTCFAVVALIATLPGCGGIGDGDQPDPVTIPLLSIGQYERSVAPTAGTQPGLLVGDYGSYGFAEPMRSLLSFNLSTLPDGVQVTHAELRLRQADFVGSTSAFQTLYVDHVDYGLQAPTTQHYHNGAKSGGWQIDSLPANTDYAVRSFAVTQAVQNDVVENEGCSQFRIRFDPAEITAGNPAMMYFEDAGNSKGTGEVPVLIVTFIP